MKIRKFRIIIYVFVSLRFKFYSIGMLLVNEAKAHVTFDTAESSSL